MVPPNSASDNDNENDPGVSLVEIEPGVAVVMGDRPLEALGLPAEFDCEVSPFQLMPPGDIQNLERPLARRVACGHRVGVKGAAGRRCASGRAVGIEIGRAHV